MLPKDHKDWLKAEELLKDWYKAERIAGGGNELICMASNNTKDGHGGESVFSCAPGGSGKVGACV